MRWSVGDASWSSDASASDDLQDRVARRLNEYEDSIVATWTWVLLIGTFIAMALLAVLH
jgi:hypothetical protein